MPKALDAEIAGRADMIDAVQRRGFDLINADHFAKLQIQVCCLKQRLLVKNLMETLFSSHLGYIHHPLSHLLDLLPWLRFCSKHVLNWLPAGSNCATTLLTVLRFGLYKNGGLVDHVWRSY